MEDRGLLAAEWGVTKNGRRARYYRLTATGRARLRAESVRLVDHFDALVTILGARNA
jgi:DNA-binding PadR family transcriptional regulator